MRSFGLQKKSMVDLNKLIPATSGWDLQVAFGISNAGTICGCGPFQWRSPRVCSVSAVSGLPQLDKRGAAGVSPSLCHLVANSDQALTSYRETFARTTDEKSGASWKQRDSQSFHLGATIHSQNKNKVGTARRRAQIFGGLRRR